MLPASAFTYRVHQDMLLPQHIRNYPYNIFLTSIEQYQKSRRLGVYDFLNLHDAIALRHSRFHRPNLPNACHVNVVSLCLRDCNLISR